MGNLKTSEDRMNKLGYMSKDIVQNTAWRGTEMKTTK